MRLTVALFGEAEKGAFLTPHRLDQLPELHQQLGNPPPDSQGLFFAVQTILYDRSLLFFRVQEEGFSIRDYSFGIKYLAKQPQVHAICMPGVGDPYILEQAQRILAMHSSILLTHHKDLFDYLISS